ncbi:MAG: hypothetical protein ACREB7_17405 [Sphingopyxis sp.]|uniref:hypothetical protein n=1 Tax=Sphingopyxis sp. TaxID=1908224 RepID=UPI003D6CCA52
MAFREKIHWVTLVTMILAFGWYFLAYPWQIADSPAGVWATAGLLVPVTIAIIVAMTVATAFLAIRNRAEVDLKEDERDRSFHMRGTHYAYYPLVVGIWINILLIFWGVGQAQQLNLMLATLVAAELVRIGTQLYLYRRGY